MSIIFKNKNGFTLAELLVTIAILGLVLGAIYEAYALNQRAYRKGEVSAELTQNSRVILERMTREIRQAKGIATELSAASTDATSTIEFEDGHDISYVHYVHYFWDEVDETIKREVVAYYFSISGNPNSTSTYVAWDATPPVGESLETCTLEGPDIIGEYVTDLKLWKSEGINISLTFKKGENSINLSTKVFGRNL